jgi:hypothetical protein
MPFHLSAPEREICDKCRRAAALPAAYSVL